jgi:hypothetical protein
LKEHSGARFSFPKRAKSGENEESGLNEIRELRIRKFNEKREETKGRTGENLAKILRLCENKSCQSPKNLHGAGKTSLNREKAEIFKPPLESIKFIIN